MRAAWAVGISGCTLRGMGGCSKVSAECPVIAVTVAALGGMATIEILMLAPVDGGGWLEACTVEVRDRLLVVRAVPGAAASWLVLAGGMAYCRN